MKRILACVDSSKVESAVIKTASALALAHGATLYLVHIETIRDSMEEQDAGEGEVHESRHRRQAMWELQGLQHHLELQEIDVVCVLPGDQMTGGIAKAIEDLQIDLVLMPQCSEAIPELMTVE
jgi:hypothetical protein